MPEKNDIIIGPDSWITWVELDLADKKPFIVDALLEPTAPFWNNLEIVCVAYCCGIDAFSLWPTDVKSAAAAVDAGELRSHLGMLRTEVLRADSKMVVSNRLNNLFDRGVFVQLIDHLLACI